MIIIRAGEVADMTDVKMHSNGAPYQLGGKGWQTDRAEDGDSFVLDLAAGDTLLAFSDGLGNNIQLPEIAQIVGECARQPADELAKTLVDRARRARLVDDDVTVVAVRLGSGGCRR